MSIRGVLRLPLTRLILALVVFVGLLAVFEDRLLAGTIRATGGLGGLALGKAVETLAALAALLLVGKLMERRSLSELGLPLRGFGRGVAGGFVFGAAIMSAIVGVLAAAGWYRVLDARNAGRPDLIAGMLGLFIVAAAVEELLFRGIIFRLLEDGLGSWLALGISSAAFGFIHSANPGATVFSDASIAVTAGLLLGGLYMLTRSLWAVTAMHTAWNFFESTVYGTTVSGLDFFPTMLHAVVRGPVLWTGGDFGPEAGLVTVIIGSLAGIGLLWLAIRRGQVRTPAWMRRRGREAHREHPETSSVRGSLQAEPPDPSLPTSAGDQ